MKLNIQKFGGRGASSESSIGRTELNDLEYYVSGMGMWINQYLRDGETLSADDKDYLKNMDKLTNSDSVKQDVLYRTMDASVIFGEMDDFAYGELREELLYKAYSGAKGTYSQNKAREIQAKINSVIGKTIPEKGFMSTSKDLGIVEQSQYMFGSTKPVVMEIRNVKGTKGYDVMKKASPKLKEVESRSPQKEVLLARNKKYKIDSISTKNGNIYVKARLV